MPQVDPPDLPLWPTLRRLLSLWRDQWPLVALGLACALTYTVLSLLIPTLIQRAIDNAVVPANGDSLLPYLAAVMVLSLLRFAINFTRRYATARIGVHIEARMRELLYNAYLRFPRAFYDRHPTGQVVSRATNDLFPVRYFIGWGMVQGIQSVMMIVGAGIVLAFVNARLTLLTALSVPPIGLVAWLFAHRVMPISRRVQVRKGDVTEAADEAVVGIEMVQAFGREDDVRARFADKAEQVRDVVIEQAGVEARHLPGLFFLPSLSIAAVVFFGGRDVIAGNLTIGQFVLFNTILLQLAWPLESLGWMVLKRTNWPIVRLPAMTSRPPKKTTAAMESDGRKNRPGRCRASTPACSMTTSRTCSALSANRARTSSSRPKACTISIPTTASSAASVTSPLRACTSREIGETRRANRSASTVIGGIATAV